MICAISLSTWEVETGGLEVEGHPWPHNTFEVRNWCVGVQLSRKVAMRFIWIWRLPISLKVALEMEERIQLRAHVY